MTAQRRRTREEPGLGGTEGWKRKEGGGWDCTVQFRPGLSATGYGVER